MSENFVACRLCNHFSENSSLCKVNGAEINHDPDVLIYCNTYDKKVYDFCTRYKMEDNLKNDSFNLRFNKPEMLYVFDEDHDKTEKLFQAFRERNQNKSNVLLMIYGPKNSGKSRISIRLMKEWLCEHFQKDIKIIWQDLGFFDSDEEKLGFLGFSDTEMSQIYRKLAKLRGKFAIRDESPKDSGTHIKTIKKNLANMCNITRGYQVCFIFLNPQRIEVEGVDYYLEMAGKDIETRISRLIIYDPSHEEGKKPIGRIYIQLEEDDDFIKEYEKRKEENIIDIMLNAGLNTIFVDPVIWERDKENLFQWCMKLEVQTKELMKAELNEYNSSCARTKRIIGDTNYTNQLIEKVWYDMKKARKKQKEEEQARLEEERKKLREEEQKLKDEMWTELHQKLIEFKPDKKKYALDYIFDVIRKESNWRDIERDLTIYLQKTKEKMLNKEILALYKELNDKSSISKIIDKVEGEIHRLRGAIHERDYTTYLESLGIFDEVNRYGDIGKPDIVARKGKFYYVFSLKCHSLNAHKGTLTENVEEFYIEIEYANRLKHIERKEVEAFLIGLNIDDFKTQLHTINITHPKPIKLIS